MDDSTSAAPRPVVIDGDLAASLLTNLDGIDDSGGLALGDLPDLHEALCCLLGTLRTALVQPPSGWSRPIDIEDLLAQKAEEWNERHNDGAPGFERPASQVLSDALRDNYRSNYIGAENPASLAAAFVTAIDGESLWRASLHLQSRTDAEIDAMKLDALAWPMAAASD